MLHTYLESSAVFYICLCGQVSSSTLPPAERLEAEAMKNTFNVNALWFIITGLRLNVTFFLFGGATAEDAATTFRGRPLRLGGSGGTGGGWRGGLPQRGGAAGASSSAVKAGLRR